MISLFISNCTASYYLTHHPNFTEKIFKQQVLRAEKKIDSNTQNPTLYLNACKLRTQYTFGFMFEKADRLIEHDYSRGKMMYKEALESFEVAIRHGKNGLKLLYPHHEGFTKENFTEVNFKKDDIPYLYWLGAAYGGAISASRGKPEWVIQLPILGDLFGSALAIDETWNSGAIHSAMISYSMARSDLKGKNLAEAINHYKKVLQFSNSEDLSANVSYAENILVYQQNKSEFIQILNDVIHAKKTKNKELIMGNIIARKRAQWLLSRKDELFY